MVCCFKAAHRSATLRDPQIGDTMERGAETPCPFPRETMQNHTPGFLIWAYVPTETLTGWQVPYVCQPPIGEVDGDVFYDAADAHRVARTLRQHYPGHLFAVVHTSRTPKVTRPELPSFL